MRFTPSSIIRCPVPQSYSATLHLPKSSFPARPPLKQPSPYLAAVTDELYKWNTSRDADETTGSFTLHDGPPYANGALHIGHALNKIVKDVVNRFWLGQGRLVHYVPGWDCHGLPIEMKALQGSRAEKGALTPVQVRKAARELAEKTVKQQMDGFKSWAVMGDWDNAYRTMDRDFELRQLDVFKDMVGAGLIYREHKPVYWSPSSRTALAESELEYADDHRSTAAFVAYPLTARPPRFQRSNVFDNVHVVVWTTTPWTLPANRAIAVHEELFYCVVEVVNFAGRPQKLLVEESRLENLRKHLGAEQLTPLVMSISGAALVGAKYGNPLNNASDQPIIHADFVSASSGTGLVHCAPGHGMDDYEVCKRLGIAAFAPVDDEGRFTDPALPTQPSLLAGKSVQGDGVNAVLDLLTRIGEQYSTGYLLATHDYTHRYPIDWRTKLPVIVRATEQWFADVESIKNSAIEALRDVKFVPESGRARLESFVNSRSQWCISRQRAWGVPIPALYRVDDGSRMAVMTKETIGHIMSVFEERGTDAWWTDDEADSAWVPDELPGTYVRGKDTMDVWFDSGTSWATLRSRTLQTPTDVYLEGSDQHRGWFQSSLLTYVADQAVRRGVENGNSGPFHAPFATLITHGFTLDQDGRKMSKSIGNVISPDEIMNGTLLPPLKRKGKKQPGSAPDAKPSCDALGPDALRLWVASSDYTHDVEIGKESLLGVNKSLHKYRVTLKWLLGTLADFDTTFHAKVDEASLRLCDRMALNQLSTVASRVHAAYASYEFHKAMKTLDAYINVDLSSFYFETLKDRLYAGLPHDRRAAQSTARVILDELLLMLSPVTPLMVEEAWQHMTPQLKGETNPLRRVWTPYRVPWHADELACKRLEEQTAEIRELHSSVNLAAETARRDGKMGTGLDCDVEIVIPESSKPPEWLTPSQDMADELASILVVSDVTFRMPGAADPSPNLGWSYQANSSLAWGSEAPYVVVRQPRRQKCPRCWRHTADEENTLCKRCGEAVK